MIIGLTGYAESGKDTVAKSMRLRGGFYRVSFADALKELALRLNPLLDVDDGYVELEDVVACLDWDRAKRDYPVVRVYLQTLGVAARDILGDDVWVMAVRAQVIGHLEEGHNVVFTDARFANEHAFIRSLGGKIVRVHRPGVEPVNNHISDTGIDALPVDAMINNDGTINELGKKVTELLKQLGA